MTKLSILIICLTSTYFVYGQHNPVHFESGMTWPEIVKKAKYENKLIFIDCYTTWCGPCKYMAAHIFNQDSVGLFFNANFINVKIQMDETLNDSDSIKQWYKYAKQIEKEFSVDSYPTYLFLSSDGTPLHRLLGSTNDGKEFINKASDAFDVHKQYYTLISQYKNHADDSIYLRNAFLAAIIQDDKINAKQISRLYLTSIKDTFATDNLDLMSSHTLPIDSKEIEIFHKNSTKIDQIKGYDYAESCIRTALITEYIEPLFNNESSEIDWVMLSKSLKERFPEYEDRIVSEAKMNYYLHTKQWKRSDTACLYFVNKYGNKLSNFDLNAIAWNAFLYSQNKTVLKVFIKQMKYRLDHHPDQHANYSNYVDTYANLQYKLGNRNEAIAWENKAIIAAKNDKRDDKVELFKSNINKFETNQKTWN